MTLKATTPLDPPDFASLRRRLIFDFHKHDPQVGDTSVIADFAVVMSPGDYDSLAKFAEALAAETLAAEVELSGRPDLLKRLGLPRRLRHAIRPIEHVGPRVMRFDFHPTRDGWRISEVNCDVPGGYIEAGPLCQLFATHFAEYTPPPAPAAALAAATPGDTVALPHATAYADDAQVMHHLADCFAAEGRTAIPCSPDQMPLADAVIRFYPAEWLPNLRGELSGWFDSHHLNPATSLITQSKRLPLVWDELSEPMQVWRTLLPPTRDPREGEKGWLLKPALGRVGEGVVMPGDETKEGQQWARRCRRWPGRWVAQQPFDSTPIDTPRGPMHACFGLFVINGKAAGIYTRLSPRPPIAAEALEVATLLDVRHPERKEPADAESIH